tara:strand:+ start:330 stop:542 length:213 start_codon:yes stop_codon:yes gene_type:complete
MRLIYLIIFITALIFQKTYSDEKKCRDLRDKPIEYSKCVAKVGKDLGTKGLKKLNTDSKLTDWIKEKIGK